MIEHRGYFSEIKYDAKEKVYRGRALCLKDDVITAQGATIEELEEAFKREIDNYLFTCKIMDEKPVRAFSGSIKLQVPPILHLRLSQTAAKQGISMNALIRNKLSEFNTQDQKK